MANHNNTNNTTDQKDLVRQIIACLQARDEMSPQFEGFNNITVDRDRIQYHVEGLLKELGFDLNHPSVEDTPERYTRFLINEACRGSDWNEFPRIMRIPAATSEIVLIRDIKVHSMCEHHLVPIIGHAHVAYIPDKWLLGLSKINRIVDFFAGRPSLQERMNAQIATALEVVLETDDVAVVVEANHFCMKYRGVQDPCSDTVTSIMRGKFFTNPQARQELLALISMKRSRND